MENSPFAFPKITHLTAVFRWGNQVPRMGTCIEFASRQSDAKATKSRPGFPGDPCFLWPPTLLVHGSCAKGSRKPLKWLLCACAQREAPLLGEAGCVIAAGLLLAAVIGVLLLRPHPTAETLGNRGTERKRRGPVRRAALPVASPDPEGWGGRVGPPGVWPRDHDVFQLSTEKQLGQDTPHELQKRHISVLFSVTFVLRKRTSLRRHSCDTTTDCLTHALSSLRCQNASLHVVTRGPLSAQGFTRDESMKISCQPPVLGQERALSSPLADSHAPISMRGAGSWGLCCACHGEDVGHGWALGGASGGKWFKCVSLRDFRLRVRNLSCGVGQISLNPCWVPYNLCDPVI